MTSLDSLEARPDFERGSNRPAGCERHAHDLSFTTFGASHLAADQRAVSPVCAGPASAFLPLASQGALSFGRVSPQPNLAVARASLKGAGGGHLFQFSRNHELAGQDARDATDALPSVLLLPAHAHEGRSRYVQGVGKGFQDG